MSKKTVKHTSSDKAARPKRAVEPFTFYIGTASKEALREIAERDGVKTLSDVIRDACNEYVERDKAKMAKAKA